MNSGKTAGRAAIVTWCYNNGPTNYGQILQCYAMQTFIRRLGYETKVIRYRKPDSEEEGRIERKPWGIRSLYELWYRLRRVEPCPDIRVLRFIQFIRKHIFLSRQCYTKEEVEQECSDCGLLVCGSDQIWNPLWFEDVYALNFGTSLQKRIAYAPSGVLLENEENEKIYRELGKYIDVFDLVTVREKKSIMILEKYTQKKIVDVVDPTLLLPKEKWEQVAAKHVVGESYVFCYSLGKLRQHKVLLKRIMKKYGAKRILFIVSGFYKNECELERGGYFYPVKNAGPAEFLALIRDAAAVCTDSFHGLALSVVYHKQFYIMERIQPDTSLGSNSLRQENLMENIGIGKERFVRCSRDLRKAGEIDYGKIHLETYRTEIKDLLKEIL